MSSTSRSRQRESPTATACSRRFATKASTRRPQDELEIVVPVGDGGAAVLHQVETLVISVGAPFVPIEHEGVIYIRPPVG